MRIFALLRLTHITYFLQHLFNTTLLPFLTPTSICRQQQKNMAYLPPHLRNKAQTNSSNPAVRVPANTFSAQEIDNHYHPGEPAANGRTLHDSAATPGQLAYVILFVSSCTEHGGPEANAALKNGSGS